MISDWILFSCSSFAPRSQCFRVAVVAQLAGRGYSDKKLYRSALCTRARFVLWGP